MEDFDYWCDDFEYGEHHSTLGKNILAFAVIASIILMMAVVVYNVRHAGLTEGTEVTDKVDDLVTVYDSPSGILKEGTGTCSECGREGWTINGDIVCRNENCPNYGLAAPAENLVE